MFESAHSLRGWPHSAEKVKSLANNYKLDTIWLETYIHPFGFPSENCQMDKFVLLPLSPNWLKIEKRAQFKETKSIIFYVVSLRNQIFLYI